MVRMSPPAVVVTTILLSLLPIIAAQKVESCSFPGVTCVTCMGRYETGTMYASSTNKCGWCGAKTTNTSDPTATNGYCLSDSDSFSKKQFRQQLCAGSSFVLTKDSSGCNFSLSQGAIAGIVIGFLCLLSALLCYSQSKKFGASSQDQKKWLLIGLVLPIVSVVVLHVLARRGHFAKNSITSPAQLPSAYAQNSAPYTGNPTSENQAPPQGYGGGAPSAPAPAAYSTQQYVSPAPYSPYDQPQPYGATSADYSNTSAPYGQQQQGYGYPPQGYSSAPPPYSNVAGV
jgi:hypothetical protein